MDDIPQEVLDAKNEMEPLLMQLEGVNGFGVGFDEQDGEVSDDLVARVMVSDASAVPDGVPSEIGGVPVTILEMDFEPCLTEDHERYDPVEGGIEIESPKRGRGTLGAIVQDDATGEPVALTCWHVVGDPDTFPDNIWQPFSPPRMPDAPPPDDDNLGDVLRGEFPRSQPFVAGALVSDVDAAVVSLAPAMQHRTISAGIVDDASLGPNMVDAIAAVGEPFKGTFVRKRGKVTHVTRGVVIDAHFTCAWNVPGSPRGWLAEQALVADLGSPDGFAIPGDSGSVVVDENAPTTAVGLLYGREFGGRYAIMSKMRNVEVRLGVTAAWASP